MWVHGGALDYSAALGRLLSLTDMERTLGSATHQPRYDLSRMAELLRRLGDPHTRVPVVHVTGTKGKGSTSAMIASILTESGNAVGLYTSPHLHTFRERIRLGGEPVSEGEFASLVERLWPVVEEMQASQESGRVTTFELLTAMAFACFAEHRLDVAVIEVGLGGTLDATNVAPRPMVCVVTPISLDHTNILGSTVEAIASDKAGIIKAGATVVTAPQLPGAMLVLEAACRDRGVTQIKVEEEYGWELLGWDLDGQRFRVKGPAGSYDLAMPLLGAHQVENACSALAAVEALAQRGISVRPQGITAGLAKVSWPGRLEVVGRTPLVVVDGAHNVASMGRLVEAVGYHFAGRRCILVLGCTMGHDLEGLVEQAAALGPALVLVTGSRHPRALPPATMASALRPFGLATQEAGTVAEAMEEALRRAEAEDLILVTGSLFTAAEAREHLLGIPGEVYPELQTIS
jgi:dihydrofolate synthase/folylpolyglutamate synthase